MTDAVDGSSAVPARPARRRVLVGGGLAALLGVVAACSGEPPSPVPGPVGAGPTGGAPPPTTTTPAGTYSGDLQAVALCAALATFAADLYGDATTVAGQGRFGPLPGAVGTLLAGAADQHTTAAAAWNQVLTTAGKPAVSGTPLTIESAYRARLGAAAAPVDLLALVVDLETTVAATVTARLGEITDPGATAVGAALAPVPAMHAATASFLLGRLPAPGTDPTTGALGRDALTA